MNVNHIFNFLKKLMLHCAYFCGDAESQESACAALIKREVTVAGNRPSAFT